MTSEQLPFYIGRYLVTGRLGSGGMGVVYLASDERLNRQVAIKRLLKNPLSNSAHLRIRQEALLLAQLNHSNIVQIYDVVEENGDIALVMEYVDGSSLHFWQRERNPSLRQKVRLLKEICAGLSRAHSVGIIHRDLKADNILIDNNNTAKISDFGIAKNWRESNDLTREQHIAGSWGAMSPEQAQGLPLDNRSDLFSLGVLAYELLCEQNPFGNSESPYVIVDRIVHNQHPPASKLNPDLPNALCQLLDRLLAKDPAQRPLNAAAVCAELEAIALHLGNSKTVASGTRTATITAEEFHRQKKLRRLGNRGRTFTRFAATAAVLLLAATALALLLPQLWRDSEGKYIAMVIPAENPALSREARILVQSTLNAIKHGLSNREGLYLVPYSESQALRGQPLEKQAQAFNAQLLLNPDISCGPAYCDLSLELIETAHFSAIANRSLTLNLNSSIGGFEQTLQQVNYMLPQYPLRHSDPNISIEEQDYRRFLELEAYSSDYRSAEVTLSTLDALEKLQEKAPRFPPIYDFYGKLAIDSRVTNYNTDAIGRLERILARAPAEIADTPEVLGARLNLAYTRYDWQVAEEILPRFKSALADPGRYYHAKAIYHMMRGEYEQAQQVADQALALRTSSAPLMQKAQALSFGGDMQAARPYLQQILELDGDHMGAISLLAANELDMGHIAETLRLLGRVSRGRLNSIDIFNLCTAHYLQKNYPQADQCFGDLYDTMPSDLEPLLYQAEIARLQQQPERTRQLAEQALELAREREGPENQLILARAYAQLRRPEDAVQTLLKIRHTPDDIYASHARAEIYITTDDLVSTKAHIRKTLELGQSPIWYQTERFAKICTHDGFTDLRGEYPTLCDTETAANQVASKEPDL